MAKILFDPPEIEYLDGQPFPKVSPKRTHSVVQFAAGRILERCAGNKGIVGPEWRFKLSAGTELLPDVAYVSYDRLKPLSDAEAEEPPFAPDVAIEVRSPSYREPLAMEKMKKYLAHGCSLVLDVDPHKRVLTAYLPGGGIRRFSDGDEFETESVPWLRFEVRELFSRIDIPR